MLEDLPLELKRKLLKKQREIIEEYFKRQKNRELKRKPKEIVLSVLDEKAKEVFAEAEKQYPGVMDYITEVLAKYIIEKSVKSIDAYELYNLLLALGLEVRLPLKIKFVRHGKELSVEEYVKDEG